MITSFVFGVFGLFSLSAFADNSCTPLFEESQPITLELNQMRPLALTKVEVFRRNNNIGLQQYGEIRLEKWFELPPHNQGFYNFIGIDREGKVYHAIDWHGKRRIARLLSGHRKFQQLVLVNENILLAVDDNGNVFVYSPDVWRKSPRNKILGQAFLIGSALFGSLATGLLSVPPEYMDPQFLPLVVGTSAAVSYMQAGYWALFKYEKINTYTDGFLPTHWKIEWLSDIEVIAEEIVRSAKSRISFEDEFSPPEQNDFPTPIAVEEAVEDIR